MKGKFGVPDFERTSIPGIHVVTTAEAKLHLRQDLSVEDDLIDDMIAAAVREVEDYAQIALITQDVTATYDGPFEAGRLRLPLGPVPEGAECTVTSVAQDRAEEVLMSSQFRLAVGKAPAIWIIEGVEQPHSLAMSTTSLRVDYSAGFGVNSYDVPDDLKHAVLDQVAQLYENRAMFIRNRHTPSMSAHAVRIAQRYRRSTV